MIIHTTAEGISLSRKLENDSAAFYEAGAKAYPQISEKLLAFARENKKNIVQIEQTYYGVITDAIEGCFALNLETNDYLLETEKQSAAGLAPFIDQATQMEDKISQFYLKAGEQCKSLMADVSRSFTLTARKKKNRLTQLTELKAA